MSDSIMYMNVARFVGLAVSALNMYETGAAPELECQRSTCTVGLIRNIHGQMGNVLR